MTYAHSVRIIRKGLFWRVERYAFGRWQTMRDLYTTRAEARANLVWWATE